MLRLALVLVTLASACASDPSTPGTPPADASTEALAVRTDSLLISVDSLRYTVAIGYPQLTGSSATVSAATVERINAVIRDSVTASAELHRPAEAVEPQYRDSPSFVAEVQGGTERVFLGDDVFSAFVEVYAFTGGAHGNTYVEPFSFNLTTGEPVGLADLFRPDAPWGDTLSAYADRALIRKMIEDAQMGSAAEARQSLYAEGYAPAAIPSVAFTLAADSLTLHFVPYEVAAYVFGGTDVPVAYTDLAPLMRTDGVAARLRAARLRAGR